MDQRGRVIIFIILWRHARRSFGKGGPADAGGRAPPAVGLLVPVPLRDAAAEAFEAAGMAAAVAGAAFVFADEEVFVAAGGVQAEEGGAGVGALEAVVHEVVSGVVLVAFLEGLLLFFAEDWEEEGD